LRLATSSWNLRCLWRTLVSCTLPLLIVLTTLSESRPPDGVLPSEKKKGYKPPIDTVFTKGRVHNGNRAQITREGAVVYKTLDGYALIGWRMTTLKVHTALDDELTFA
jgi:hypothetical protein